MPPKVKSKKIEYRAPGDAAGVRILVPGEQLFNRDARESERRSSYVYLMITAGIQPWPKPVVGMQWGLKCVYQPGHPGNEYITADGVSTCRVDERLDSIHALPIQTPHS